ncbi:hypothetical protein HDV01_004428 [Terramyces sp. JEL0728]|nr:hypothetical protein HDV01_004428 [Terramyces sp. JEL0728]
MDIYSDQDPDYIIFTNNFSQPVQISTYTSTQEFMIKPGRTKKWKAETSDFLLIYHPDWKRFNLGIDGTIGIYVLPGSHIFFNKPQIQLPDNVSLIPHKRNKIAIHNLSKQELNVWVTTCAAGNASGTPLAFRQIRESTRDNPEFILIRKEDGEEFGFLCPPGFQIVVNPFTKSIFKNLSPIKNALMVSTAKCSSVITNFRISMLSHN